MGEWLFPAVLTTTELFGAAEATGVAASVLQAGGGLATGGGVSAGIGAASGIFGSGIGFGDVKLGIFLGLLVPWPQTLVLFFLAYLIGAVVGLALIAYGSKSLQSQLPFGTFLTLAAFLAMLWGQELIHWYFELAGIS